jgi:hypothetical protein
MSTPTTARGVLLRRAGTLLVAAALVAGPATAALADPTAGPTPEASPTASATATATPSANPSPEASASPVGSATTTPSPDASTSSASPSDGPTPSETTATTPTGPEPSPSATSSATSPVPSPSASDRAVQTLAAVEDTAAAAFIARTLADGGDHYVYPGGTFFDGGNTIDAITALSAVGTQQAQSDASLTYLESHLGDYVGSFGEVYAGPLAKSLLAAVVTGADPRSFGGHDLVAELQALETTKGRFSDDSAYGDYSNTIGQSLAVLALARSGQALNAPSVQLLLDRQCADGGFSGDLAGGGTCTTDLDATAFATQALLVAADTLLCGSDDEGLASDVAAAAQRGLDLLEDAQQASGGFVSQDGVVNANTTGVAAQAFTAGGRGAAADAATAFIKTLQYDDSSPEALRGGIAFSGTTRSTTTPTDSDLRATPQAALALAGGSLVDTLAPGVVGAAPGTTCPPSATRAPVVAPTPTPTTSPSGTPSSTATPTGGSTGSAGSGGDGGSDAAGAVGSDSSGSAATSGSTGTTGSLAQTGSDLLLPVGLGLALVLVGALAVAASRRRGAHA